ncbi:MAG: hypothetical protein P0Y66_16715 [Candidatus Kaistia colombiensis]|nr:MAG: hypothetical protein P0Y66_16715 [Kaistia sp.]
MAVAQMAGIVAEQQRHRIERNLDAEHIGGIVVQGQRHTGPAPAKRPFGPLVDIGGHEDVLGQKIAGNGGDGGGAQPRLAAELDARQRSGTTEGSENEATVLATHKFGVGFALHDSPPRRQHGLSIIDFQAQSMAPRQL